MMVGMEGHVWVEFNDLDSRGRVTTLAEHAAPGVSLRRCAVVVVGDDEGNRATARVVGRRWWRRPALIRLQADLTTFRAPGAVNG
jgi:hypothetical protein